MTTALLVIDVQESFRARTDDWAGASGPDIADRIDRLVTHSRAAGHEVVWILHSEPGSGSVFDPDSGHVRVFDELTPADTEALLHKTSHNAFTTTRLGQHLTAAGVTEVIVAGIRTEQCCETTARVASDLGYAVRFVLDATVTMPLARWDGAGVLTTDEVLARTASALQGRFAEVVTIDDVVAS